MTDHIVATGAKGLLMKKGLVQSLKKSGVDNIQIYPVRLIDVSGACISDDYNIVNIVGCVRAIDMEMSDVEMHPEFPDEVEFIND